MAIQTATSFKGRAAVLHGFGDASHLRIEQRTWPEPKPHEVLVRVHASSINPIEWKMREGLGLPRFLWRHFLGPRPVLGIDFSGTVAAAGADSGYRIGEEVLGALPLNGAYADYVTIDVRQPRSAIAIKPTNVSHGVAGVVPFAARVALAGRATVPTLEGKSIVVVGASGGVGHLAMQIAKSLGAAHVVGIASSRNRDFVLKHGADEAVAYDVEDVSMALGRSAPFDLILDCVGDDRYFTAIAPKVLAKNGMFSSIALPSFREGKAGEDVGGIGAISVMARIGFRRLRGGYHMVPGLIEALPGSAELLRIAGWLGEGRLVPHIASTFPLEQIADAQQESERGRTVGKISISMV